jgi:hypothetical protein
VPAASTASCLPAPGAGNAFRIVLDRLSVRRAPNLKWPRAALRLAVSPDAGEWRPFAGQFAARGPGGVRPRRAPRPGVAPPLATRAARRTEERRHGPAEPLRRARRRAPQPPFSEGKRPVARRPRAKKMRAGDAKSPQRARGGGNGLAGEFSAPMRRTLGLRGGFFRLFRRSRAPPDGRL